MPASQTQSVSYRIREAASGGTGAILQPANQSESGNGMVRPCSCPASDKLARGAKTRSTPWLRQHRVRLP